MVETNERRTNDRQKKESFDNPFSFEMLSLSSFSRLFSLAFLSRCESSPQSFYCYFYFNFINADNNNRQTPNCELEVIVVAIKSRIVVSSSLQ